MFKQSSLVLRPMVSTAAWIWIYAVTCILRQTNCMVIDASTNDQPIGPYESRWFCSVQMFVTVGECDDLYYVYAQLEWNLTAFLLENLVHLRFCAIHLFLQFLSRIFPAQSKYTLHASKSTWYAPKRMFHYSRHNKLALFPSK